MEDYATFVQHHLSSLRKKEEDNKPSPSSSLICFYGRPILPPLLSGEQREEMQRHRDEAQKAAVHRKFQNDSRMAFVQTILHSVQLRKTPTLEELLQESEIDSEHHHTGTGSGTHCNLFRGTKDDPLLPSSLNSEAKDGVPLPPFTSTTYSAYLATNMTPHLEECLTDPHPSQHGSLPSPLNGVSHQSSGYVTYENVANTSSVSGGIDTGMESHDYVPSEGAHSLGAFFLHNTSNTIIKMPDIISYPPIDGEELERSGLESSFCNDFVVAEDICCSALKEDSVKSNSLQEEKSESSSESEANLSVPTILDPVKDKKSDSKEGQESLSESREFSGDPESQTISVQHCPTAELQIQQDPTEKERADNHEDEEESSEEPYRLSLQALLKKSQEYRRRQRMLRNQAKNSKIQEGTQEQPRVRVEEPSLSDKENDEFPHKGNSTAERKKTKDTSGTIVQMSPKNSWDNERATESELYNGKTNYKNESTNSSEDEKTKGRSGDDDKAITLRNNKMNTSQELMAEPKRISTFAQEQSLSTETLFCKSSPTDSQKGRKYQNIPAPNFCKSPVRCKSKGGFQDEDNVDNTGTSKVPISAGLLNNEKVHQGSQNGLRAVSPKVMPLDECDFRGIPIRSSQQIDQLESNLCGLKILISDLESTLTGNFKNQSQTENSLMQSDDEESRDVDLDPKEPQRRQSSDDFKIISEDSESALSLNGTDNVPIAEQEKSTEEVNDSELRLLKTLVTERESKKICFKGGLSKSSGHHGGFKKQQPTAKCLLSAAQRQKIPDMFRNVASKAAAPCNTSVLSDTSNHPVEKRNKEAEERLNATRSPSLNQSYDVDAPSGLWLLEGLGLDLGPRGHLLQDIDLTPESEGEGQGGVSRVKRRLLMHTTEEIPQRGTDSIRGADSVVRPNSSTPRAAVRWNEGHHSLKERQEQLQQAHAAQVRALQEEHRRQQEELLQPSGTLSERCRPLLLAAVKGFLTRRLLKTERVAQLVRTVRDTRQLLQALQQQQQNTSAGKFSGEQDLLLQERVALQLRAARYEVNDIFFSLSGRERMQLISWDRELVRERELRRQSGHTGHPPGKSSLSAATQKSLERKRRMMMQKKAAGRPMGAVTKAGHNAGSSAEQPPETKRGQFRANPQRVPKSTYSSRPR
ncbi:uncharacterized protein si:ch73-100l22.3 isoform X2 [Xyrichtys novacula]|uniref:Uncharacterized protein si:ch73-100l22.3 isoform X2 n=1 Tax=Xyrichtys novacula TaxID=13765 RepID=A0AAV1EYG8_XYRNO|nr:uncharacterized protein si:ch73-100l22.3 isoform X2 [Xyrichtys novacula]